MCCRWTISVLLLPVALMAIGQSARQPFESEREEVGYLLEQYNSRTDRRYPHELGLGYYYQGDILLPETASEDRLSIAEQYSSTLWPRGIVPYVIDRATFSPREVGTIQAAMNAFHTSTCVRFVPRTVRTRHYLTITNRKTGCYASVGRQEDNGRNIINLQSPGCLSRLGTPIHELMHSLGFLHEVSRPDRDDYVYINRSALAPEYRNDNFYNTNYAKYEDGVETYSIPYNYGSVMHYSKYAGASDIRYPVLMNKQPYLGDFGSDALSPTDVAAVNYRYCRNVATNTTTTVTRRPPFSIKKLFAFN